MEDLHFDAESNWAPHLTLRLEYGGEVFALRWDNTHVYRHSVEDGRYDYLEHTADEGRNLQVFMDETDLGNDLDNRDFRVTRQGFVSADIVEARRMHEADIQGDAFAAELEEVTGPEDLLA
ncbi:MAG TPA: hypothetical protein VIJ68_04570 [Candidatus Saccharimonadales bacterium]